MISTALLVEEQARDSQAEEDQAAPQVVSTAKTADTISYEATRLPTTWAGVAYLRHHVPRLLLGYVDVEMAIALWIGFRAAADRAAWEQAHPNVEPAPIGEYIDFYTKRIFGFDGYGVARVYFDAQRNQMMRLEPDGAHRPILIRGETLSLRSHVHELRSCLCHRLKFDKESGITVIEIVSTMFSLWNKALSGSRRGLALLGVPVVERVDFPAAFFHDDVHLADDGVIELRYVGRLHDANDQLDVVAYFDDLRKRGVLPLDTEEDVRRFIVALALPLIRYVAVGLLGVCWVLGPPGAGKDFMAELAPDLWRAAVMSPTSKSKFDLDGGRDELELKRCLSQAGGAVYGRAKEAAKRGEAFITALIRIGGTDQIASRAMRQDEIEIANTYTLIADSAEDVPDRREIYRRTITIRVRRLDDDALGEARAEVMSRAPEIIASLRRLVEAQPSEYFTLQRGTNGRPVGQVAMARLFGVNLEAVVGRNLDEVWDALIDFSKSLGSAGEIRIALDKLANDKRVAEDVRNVLAAKPSALAIYRISALMKASTDRLSVHHLFFANFKSASGVVNLIKREHDYDTEVRKRGYLRVEVGGGAYALRLLRDDRFVLWMGEPDYRMAMGLEPLPSDDAPVEPPPVEASPETIAADQFDKMVASVMPHIPVGAS